MSSLYQSEAEKRLRERIAGLIDPRDELVRLSRIILQVVQIGEPCHAYIISYRRLGIAKKGYFFALYLKTPGARRLAVFDRCYRDAKECQKVADSYLRYFPLFLYSSRFLLEPAWKEKPEKEV